MQNGEPGDIEQVQINDEVVEIVALLAEAERRLYRLGTDQVMSIGPALNPFADLQRSVVALADGHGVLGEEDKLVALKDEANETVEVTVSNQE